MNPVHIEGLGRDGDGVRPPDALDLEDERARKIAQSAAETEMNLQWLARHAPADYTKLRRRIENLIRRTRTEAEADIAKRSRVRK